jgi:hypothetical protein
MEVMAPTAHRWARENPAHKEPGGMCPTPTQPSTALGWTWRAMAASNQAPGRVRVNASGSRLTALAPRASIDLMRKASRTWT